MSAPATRATEPAADPARTNGAHHRPATHTHNRVAPQQLTGAEAVVRSLEELGVDVIFGIPGGAVLPVYDPLFDSNQLRHVLVRHEQGAGHAASSASSEYTLSNPIRKPSVVATLRIVGEASELRK